MMYSGRAVAAAVLLLAASTSGLFLPRQEQPQPQALSAHEVATEADVQSLRGKLASVVAGFDALIKSEADSFRPPGGGPTKKEKAWADVRSFVARVRHALAERLQSPTLAMETLEDVKAEVPKYMALALGKPATEIESTTGRVSYDTTTEAESSPKVSSVEKTDAPTRTDVEALRSSFANVTDTFHVTQADVDSLRLKLKKVSLGLQDLLDSKLSSLMRAHVELRVKSFVVELHRVLAETIFMTPADALPKLEVVQARMHEVTSDLTSKEEALMREAETQKESLLLSVLVTLQHASMEQQLSVLNSTDFAPLLVCKALLERHADNVPLYQQAALFLDGKVPEATLQAIVSNATAHHRRVVRAQADIATFDGRIAGLAHDLEDKAKAHTRRSEQLVDAVKRASGSTASIMEKMAQREEEGFNKYTVSQHHDVKVLQEAVAALKQDDVDAAIKLIRELDSPMKDLLDELESI